MLWDVLLRARSGQFPGSSIHIPNKIDGGSGYAHVCVLKQRLGGICVLQSYRAPELLKDAWDPWYELSPAVRGAD